MVVFCQGIAATDNPWFRDVEFKPAKGEILTVRVPGLAEDRVIHRRVWLAPLGHELFRVGSTYDWKQLDCELTQDGLEQILSRLKEFLRRPVEVVNHQAAVRPIHRNQYPVLGPHLVHSQLGFFNGLGSKGTLHAPFFADQFVRHLLHGEAIDADVDLNAKTTWSDPTVPRHVERRRNPPLTEQAQAAVATVLSKGAIVIDATAGNGYDTHFLASSVGDQGRSVRRSISNRSDLSRTRPDVWPIPD